MTLSGRACCDCGRPTGTMSRNRCAEHWAAHRVTTTERAEHRALRERWVAEHGLVCPGFERDAHAVESIADLTADHVVPRARGGRRGKLQVLCRSCNERKAGRADATPKQAEEGWRFA